MRSATSTRATTTSRPRATTPSGGSISARSGRRRCSASCASSSAPSSTGATSARWRSAPGTGYFSLNLLQTGARARSDVHRHLSAGWWRASAPTRSTSGCTSGPRAPTPSRSRSQDGSFDLVLGHAVLHHLPDLRRAFAEFHRVLRPAAGSRSPASHPGPGDRLAAIPKRGAALLAPLWRRSCAAPRRPPSPRQPGPGSSTTTSSSGSSTSTRSRPTDLSRTRCAARVQRHQRARRGAGRQLVRLVQPRARGQRRPGRRADAVAPVRVPRLPAAAATRRHACSSRCCRRRSSTTCCCGAQAGRLPTVAARRLTEMADRRDPRLPAVPAGDRRAPRRADPAAHLRGALQDDDEPVPERRSASSGSCGCRMTGCERSAARAQIEHVLERMEDGRMNLLARGTRPFRVLERQAHLPYPAGRGRVRRRPQ